MLPDWNRQPVLHGNEPRADYCFSPSVAVVGKMDLARHFGHAYRTKRHPFVAGEPPPEDTARQAVRCHDVRPHIPLSRAEGGTASKAYSK